MEQGQDEYGYEICVTIGDNITINDTRIKTKTLPGGLYAVTGVRRNKEKEIGNEIMKAWQRFNSWLKDSKYIYGGHQWLEEHQRTCDTVFRYYMSFLIM